VHPFFKSTKMSTRDLRAGQSHFYPWENHGAGPLRMHFCAREGGIGWVQSAYI